MVTQSVRDYYGCTAARPPNRQDLQMPKPLPLVWMNPQRFEIRVNSAALRVAVEKRVSVSPYVVAGVPEVTGKAWIVVPKAAMPVTGKLVPVPTVDALQEAAVVPADANSLITIDVGTPGVRVLLIKSLRAEREISAFGVTRQEQQEINCSSGENVYTFTQRLPF